MDSRRLGAIYDSLVLKFNRIDAGQSSKVIWATPSAMIGKATDMKYTWYQKHGSNSGDCGTLPAMYKHEFIT